VSWRRERSAKTAGGPGPLTGSRIPIYYPDPLAGREQTPRLRGSGAATCPQAQARAQPRGSLGKTWPPTAFNAGDVKCALPQQSPRRLLPGCTVGRTYQGAQYSRWSHLCHSHQSATPVRHDSSATEYHNAYAVDSTVYAATHTASTGASLMGQVKTPLRSKSLQCDEAYPGRDSQPL